MLQTCTLGRRCNVVWWAHQGMGVGVDVGECGAQVRGGRAEAEEAERVVHPVLPRIVHQARVGGQPGMVSNPVFKIEAVDHLA